MPQKRKFRIPVEWKMTATVYRTAYYRNTVEIEAETLEEAIEIAEKDEGGIYMGDGECYDSGDDDYGDSEYRDGSYEVNYDEAKHLAAEDGNLLTPEEANMALDIED